MQGPKKKKHKKISKTPILKSAIPTKRSFKNMRELTPFLPSLVSKIAMPLVGLCLSFMILGCGSGGGGGTTTPTPPSLTLEQRIGKARAEALANGCTVVDININYSLLTGGENHYGGNIISKQGDKGGAIEKVPSTITIKCGDQIHNFVFADEAEQSDNVKKANEAPVGDINAFFKTDKNTEEDVEAYIKEKIDLTSLCRFSVYPAFAGTIDDDSTETLSVAASGKDCEMPKWYINDNSTPIAEGNSLVASISNLLSGENDITIKVTNPAGTNSLYIKRIQGWATNDPATAIKVSVKPTEVHATTPRMTGSEVVTDIDESVIVREWYDNDVLMSTGATTYDGPFFAGHKIKYKATADDAVSDSVEIIVIDSSATGVKSSITPADVYATTPSITGSEVVTDPDGGTSLVREWYDNGVLVASGVASYAGPFVAGHTIIYKVTADGVVKDSASVIVKYSSCTVQFTTCYPLICAIPSSYDEGASMTIDGIINTPDTYAPSEISVTGERPEGVGLAKNNNRVTISGTPATGSGASPTPKAYGNTVTVDQCSETVNYGVLSKYVPPGP